MHLTIHSTFLLWRKKIEISKGTEQFPDKEVMQQQPQPVITSLQPVIINNSRDSTHQFLESGGMLALPSSNPVDDSNPERTENTDSGLYPAQF